MEYKQEYVELIEKIVKNCPGYKGNEDLLEEFVRETYKKSLSFLESSMETSSLEIYIKKIAGNVIVETVRNADTIRAQKAAPPKKEKEFEEVPVSYETDNEGKIVYKPEFPPAENASEPGISEEKLIAIKNKVIELDKKSSSKNYKEIFELRFAKEMTNTEIAQKLEMEEKEVSDTVYELFTEIDSA